MLYANTKPLKTTFGGDATLVCLCRRGACAALGCPRFVSVHANLLPLVCCTALSLQMADQDTTKKTDEYPEYGIEELSKHTKGALPAMAAGGVCGGCRALADV